jgi:chromosome transmission fidelity protein 8
MQGSINLPPHEDISSGEAGQNAPGTAYETPIGRLVFPEYKHGEDAGEGKWMKKVHLYIGKHQRMTGEVKRLPTALAVIRRRKEHVLDAGEGNNGNEGKGEAEELEIVEIVKYKILFSQRPEPVGGLGHEEL